MYKNRYDQFETEENFFFFKLFFHKATSYNGTFLESAHQIYFRTYFNKLASRDRLV